MITVYYAAFIYLVYLYTRKFGGNSGKFFPSDLSYDDCCMEAQNRV